MGFYKKFLSRKFLAAVIGAVVGVTGKTLGLPPEVVKTVIGVLVVYIAGESALDLTSRIKK